MANARHHNQITHLVELVARQVTAASARDNEFTQSTLNRSSDAGLMRQHVQSVKDEIQQFTGQRIFGFGQKFLQPKQVIKRGPAQE